MDSAGAMLPSDVGFHAHDNLGLAIGNTPAGIEAGATYGIDPHEMLLELGEREVVGGQEDLITDVASRLASERDAAAESDD
ncbi:hypothetical protein ACFQGE_12170 [Halomicroarcula sp. GCM10025817]|uniref:hypothetical protein n=1 Tax=Haloarcula TaxID=2237 RepID=UPI0023E81B49|nr:hypothetical protein [Halomicroarcula sp. SYNS111]